MFSRRDPLRKYIDNINSLASSLGELTALVSLRLCISLLDGTSACSSANAFACTCSDIQAESRHIFVMELMYATTRRNMSTGGHMHADRSNRAGIIDTSHAVPQEPIL